MLLARRERITEIPLRVFFLAGGHMPPGTLCPQCGKPVMPYLRFFREAEPYKISRCSHCQVELKRNKVAWLLLCVAAAAGAAVAGLGITYVFARWGAAGTLALGLVVLAVLTFGLNVCGWLFVGWELAAPSHDRSGPSQQEKT
jgi:hypothetical protein